MKRDRNYLIEMYNATSTGNEHDELETYEAWLERQLLSRIEKLENKVQIEYSNCPTCCHTGSQPWQDCQTCGGIGQYINKDQRFRFPDAEKTLKLDQ